MARRKALRLRTGKVKKILSQVWKGEQELREDEAIQHEERGLFRAPQVLVRLAYKGCKGAGRGRQETGSEGPCAHGLVVDLECSYRSSAV